ncbi:MAG: hypothetical protein EOP44_08335 [Sphingobacteriaceae bacterium]|nr:MAG: hypothetical protein EOP44_08335 [Sphingobacteriaceae bacterium]
MWNNHDLNVTVIENGVPDNTVSFSGDNAAGVMVLEEFPADDRIIGMDIFRQVKEVLPIEVIQIGKDGLTYQNLPEKLKNYRFLLCADRYQSTSNRFLADWNQLFAHTINKFAAINHNLTAC